MKYYEYDFVITAADNGAYVAADKDGGSFYLPRQILNVIPQSGLRMGDLLHITASEKLEFTERSATNSIICHGTVHVSLTGSLQKQGRTGLFLVSSTAYGSVLLTDIQTGKDYLIFTSYITEGYRTPGIHWHTVTEGNVIPFLLFGDMPVMPAPHRKHIYQFLHRVRKAPAVQNSL